MNENGENDDDPMSGFQYIPVFNYYKPDTNDDLLTAGCKYIDDSDRYYYPRNDTYSDVAEYIMPVLRAPLKKVINLTDEQAWNMTFVNVYDYSDQLLAEDKEGINRSEN